MQLQSVTFAQLTIDDESQLRHVGLYERLKKRLARSSHKFLIPAAGAAASWDRVLFLNLTFWSESEGIDVLCDSHITADVVAHIAWHHLVAAELARAGLPGPAGGTAMLFAEAIASAFDLYLMGRLLGNAPDSDFVTSQLPIMAEAAQEAGLSEADFENLMEEVVAHPERAFEEVRCLLFDVGCQLLACRSAIAAQTVLEGFSHHRFSPLLHHFQLSNWILYARAYAAAPARSDEVVRGVDSTLRQAAVSLDWLADHWIDADQTA